MHQQLSGKVFVFGYVFSLIILSLSIAWAQDACTDKDDVKFWRKKGGFFEFKDQLGFCTLQQAAFFSDSDFVSIYSTCLKGRGMPYVDGCLECFSLFAKCAFDSCTSECVDGLDSSACITCVDDVCNPTFLACGGDQIDPANCSDCTEPLGTIIYFLPDYVIYVTIVVVLCVTSIFCYFCCYKRSCANTEVENPLEGGNPQVKYDDEQDEVGMRGSRLASGSRPSRKPSTNTNPSSKMSKKISRPLSKNSVPITIAPPPGILLPDPNSNPPGIVLHTTRLSNSDLLDEEINRDYRASKELQSVIEQSRDISKSVDGMPGYNFDDSTEAPPGVFMTPDSHRMDPMFNSKVRKLNAHATMNTLPTLYRNDLPELNRSGVSDPNDSPLPDRPAPSETLPKPPPGFRLVATSEDMPRKTSSAIQSGTKPDDSKGKVQFRRRGAADQ